MNILVLNGSVRGVDSVSRGLVAHFLDALRAAGRADALFERDLGADPVPHLLPETVAGIAGVPESEAQRTARALSDRLIEELKQADLIVIGAPMYNFGMTSTLKAWFDHVLRAGLTFRYSEAGPEGLVTGRKAVVVESRNGFYSEGPGAASDHQEPHIRTLLAFMGITDVAFVRAERLAFGPDEAARSIADARDRLTGIAAEFAA